MLLLTRFNEFFCMCTHILELNPETLVQYSFYIRHPNLTVLYMGPWCTFDMIYCTFIYRSSINTVLCMQIRPTAFCLIKCYGVHTISLMYFHINLVCKGFRTTSVMFYIKRLTFLVKYDTSSCPNIDILPSCFFCT